MLSQEKAQKIARKYLLWNVGNLPGVSEPLFGEYMGRDVWYIPIVLKDLKIDLGRLVIDSETGEVLRAPSRSELTKRANLIKSISIELPVEYKKERGRVLKAIVGEISASPLF